MSTLQVFVNPHAQAVRHPAVGTLRLLGVGEVAKLLHVHPETIKDWARKGYIGYSTTEGGHYRFTQLEVERLLSQQEALREGRPMARPPMSTIGFTAHDRASYGAKTRPDGLVRMDNITEQTIGEDFYRIWADTRRPHPRLLYQRLLEGREYCEATLPYYAGIRGVQGCPDRKNSVVPDLVEVQINVTPPASAGKTASTVMMMPMAKR